MELVICPAVDPTKSRGQSSKSSSSYKDDEKEMRCLFYKVCACHIEPPLDSIYQRALTKARWNHANEMLMSRASVMPRDEHSWLASTNGWQSPQATHGSSRDLGHRRRSAPMLNKQDNTLLSLGEKLNAFREDVDALLNETIVNHRSAKTVILHDGRSSRARGPPDNEHQALQNEREPSFDQESTQMMKVRSLWVWHQVVAVQHDYRMRHAPCSIQSFQEHA